MYQLSARSGERQMKNQVTINNDGTANILCERKDGTEVKVRVDIIDLEKVNKIPGRWCVVNTNDCTEYCMTNICDERTKSKRTVYMHRLIMGFPDGMEIDHHDTNGLNNTRKNLAIMDRKENAAKMRLNDSPRSHNRQGHRNIRKVPSGRYAVRVQNKYMGTFDTVKQAENVASMLRSTINICRTGVA